MVSQGAGVSPLDVFGSQLGDTIDGLLRYAVTLTGNSSDAEDLVMETVVRSLEKRDQFRQESSLATWLHSILYHIAVDKVRSDSKELSVDEVVGKWMNSEYSVDIEADLIRKETQMKVREALRRLPYNYRAAIILHDAEGLSAREISQLCGASLSTIKQRILRGRMMLLTALKSVDVSKLSTDTGSLSCWESRQMISDYLDDSLAQRQRNALEQHLSSCTTCPPLYRSLVGLRRVLGDLCEGDDDVPSEIRDRVLAKLSIGG